jgi:hypothetical protein
MSSLALYVNLANTTVGGTSAGGGGSPVGGSGSDNDKCSSTVGGSANVMHGMGDLSSGVRGVVKPPPVVNEFVTKSC